MSIIEYDLDGMSVYIEGNDLLHNDDVMAPATSGKIIEKAKVSFGEAIDSIKPMIEKIMDTLSNMQITPDETDVELSLKFSADLGAVLTSLSSEANIKILLKWKK